MVFALHLNGQPPLIRVLLIGVVVWENVGKIQVFFKAKESKQYISDHIFLAD